MLKTCERGFLMQPLRHKKTVSEPRQNVLQNRIVSESRGWAIPRFPFFQLSSSTWKAFIQSKN